MINMYMYIGVALAAFVASKFVEPDASGSAGKE
eukprot:CAMPEP_0114584636 /NCGR_PEP_ID=MMETSP0125-20121206/8303_1 /TAXON_ID=485358 ORGANISM="Aristerostoma sp., Strain ATCC 50986" /NCGR_SAMPLE_ID=MMETSP0125 /ASSEMBLY_ACC=CAM_ASM_000245 /LENGTH=32 /DNA_ID= /DNA_START= /DNA_END= /DNA_ORIENTATION=